MYYVVMPQALCNLEDDARLKIYNKQSYKCFCPVARRAHDSCSACIRKRARATEREQEKARKSTTNEQCGDVIRRGSGCKVAECVNCSIAMCDCHFVISCELTDRL